MKNETDTNLQPPCCNNSSMAPTDHKPSLFSAAVGDTDDDATMRDAKSVLAQSMWSVGLGGFSTTAAEKLVQAGYSTEEQVLGASKDELKVIKGLPRLAYRCIVAYQTIKAQDAEVDVELLYNESRETKPMRQSLLSLSMLCSAVKQVWPELEESSFHLRANSIALSNETSFSDYTYPLQITVITFNSTISSTSLDNSTTDDVSYAYTHASSAVMTDEDKFPGAAEIDTDDKNFQHALDGLTIKHQLFGTLTARSDHARRELISLVLTLSAQLAGVQLPTSEYRTLFQSYRIYIAEGQNDDLSQGVAQTTAQLVATREDGNAKRPCSPTTAPMYGIATTYHEWVFLKLADEPRELFRLTDEPLVISPKDLATTIQLVVARIVGILTHQKSEIDSEAGCEGTKKKRFGEKELAEEKLPSVPSP